MEIERLDEADALVVGHEQADDQRVAILETRDLQTYHAEYRATVEVTLELHQVWEAHKAKWPPPEDSGGDVDRHLDPEANAEVERGCGRIREIAENILTPAMRAIESEDPDRHLIGLDYCLKGTERLKEKVATALEEQPNLTPRQALSAVPDAIRFTLSYSNERYTAGVTADMERLTARGCELAKPLRNSWESDQYKGINSQWRESTTGQLFEVQFHTQVSFEAKQLSHAAYERIRNPQTSDTEMPELEDFQRQVCAKIPVPPGAADIAYLPRKERDG